MKNKIFFKVVVIFLLSFCVMLNGYATEAEIPEEEREKTGTLEEAPKEDDEEKIEWTDFSNAQMKVVQENDTVNCWRYKLTLEGVQLKEDRSYQVYLKVGEGEPDYTIDTEKDWVGYLDAENYTFFDMTLLADRFEQNGKIYCWIVEELHNGTKGAPYKAEIPRLPQHNVGSRIKCYFFRNETSTNFYEAHDIHVARKINLKIGTITDNNILLSIKNGEANCLQNLMNYAKTASSIYTETVPLGKSATITSGMNLVHEGYYYVYMQMDEEGGTYYPVEDVSLYQALIGETIGKNLYDYLSDDFKWNLTENPSPSPTPTPTNPTPAPAPNPSNPAQNNNQPDNTIAPMELPKTGFAKAIMIACLVCIVIGLISAYQYNKYKEI